MGVRLPSEYQEVEYLDSASALSPYIDTGIPITEDLTFEIDFQLSDITSRMYFMGWYNGTDFFLYVGISKYFQTAFGATFNNTTLTADIQRHKFIYQINNGTLIVKDSSTTILTKNISSFSGNSILVAGTKANPSASIPCKTFESKMTKAGVVIQDLIPCYRKSDSKPGMYDLVTKQFFTNAGTGEFVVGPDVIDSISPLLVAWRRALMMRKPARLPAEYQKVEYIKGTGSQYINTLFNPSNNTKIKCVALWSNIRSSAGWLYGARNDISSAQLGIYVYGSQAPNRVSVRYNINAPNQIVDLENLITLQQDTKYFRANNVNIYTFTDQVFQCNYPLCLLACNTGGTISAFGLAQIYSVSIYEDNVAKRNLVPCYRKSDSEAGMYDLVSKTFFTNAGTGEFIVGPNIN